MDSNGTILLQEHANERTYPGESTRMMLLLLATEQLERGILKPDTPVTISETAVTVAGVTDFSFGVGTQIPLTDAMRILALRRCANIQGAIAETLAKNQDACLAQMNTKARTLGMNKTRYVDFTGMDGRADLTSRKVATTSAKDMAILGRELLRHPIAADLLATKDWKTSLGSPKPRLLRNTNRGVSLGYIKDCIGVWAQAQPTRYSGCSGIFAVERKGKKYILAIMNCAKRENMEAWAAFLLDRVAPPSDGSAPHAQPPFYLPTKK